MRIGLVEFILILLIASLAIGPQVALWVDRWMRRAQKTSAAASRRRAAMQAQAVAEREYVLHRFRVTARIFTVAALLALLYALFLRPIEAQPQPYAQPIAPVSGAGQTGVAAKEEDRLTLEEGQTVNCVRAEDGWIYLAARTEKRGKTTGSALLRMREDGSGLTSILTTEGEITGFDFDPDGNLWLTLLTENGGALCRAGYDGWGAAMEQVVTQIDGKALTSPSAVTVGADGRVYFAVVSATSAENGLEAALRTELMAHTATGSVYVYDPEARTVQPVMDGIAGASGLALSPDGGTLYISDLGNRCVWAVPPRGRELTAGGKGCEVFAEGLPGYPGSLAADEDGEVWIGFRWARSGWLEDHAEGTLLRGAALRLSQNLQEGLFRLGAEDCAVAGYSPDSALLEWVDGKTPGSVTTVCPAGNRVWLGSSGGSETRWVRV